VEGIKIDWFAQFQKEYPSASGEEPPLVLEEMRISSLGVYCTYTYRLDSEWVTPGPGVVKAVMKDGSEAEIVTLEDLVNGKYPPSDIHFDKEYVMAQREQWLEIYENSKTGDYITYTVVDNWYFDSPIDLNEVAYIRFGDQQIQVG